MAAQSASPLGQAPAQHPDPCPAGLSLLEAPPRPRLPPRHAAFLSGVPSKPGTCVLHSNGWIVAEGRGGLFSEHRTYLYLPREATVSEEVPLPPWRPRLSPWTCPTHTRGRVGCSPLPTPQPPPSSHVLCRFLSARGSPGGGQEAASGRDAAAGRCREQAADSEGGAGLPEEHLQRGRHCGPGRGHAATGTGRGPRGPSSAA